MEKTEKKIIENERGRSLSGTSRMIVMALFSAIICISAYISIPLPLPGAPHVTMQNFVIILIALLFSSTDSFLIIMVWMALGAVGLPVFIGGKAGLSYLLMPYGGYTAVFPLVGLILPLIRGKKYNRLRFTAVALFGAVLIDIIGMLRLMQATNLNLAMGIATGFIPFIPLDLMKCLLAAQLVPVFYRTLKQGTATD